MREYLLKLLVLIFNGLLVFGEDLDCGHAPRRRVLQGFTCPEPSTAWSRKHAESLAWKYAPIVYTHPLEKYHLMDPKVWAQETQLYDRFFRAQPSVPHFMNIEGTDAASQSESLGQAIPNADKKTGNHQRSWLYWSFLSALNTSKADALMRGAPFDHEGNSEARVWYSLMRDEASGAVIYNYNLFYGYAGMAAWHGEGYT